MSAESQSAPNRKLQPALREVESWRSAATVSRERRFKRYTVRGLAQLHGGSPVGEQVPPMLVHVRDISRGGLGVLSSLPAQPGQQWQVQFVDDHMALATMPGFCRFCRGISDGAYLLGIEFAAEASVLMAMGVSVADLACGDRNEHADSALANGDDFVDPSTLAA